VLEKWQESLTYLGGLGGGGSRRYLSFLCLLGNT